MKVKFYHIVAIWLAFALVMSAIMYIVHPPGEREFSFFSEFKWELAFSVSWILATPFVFRMSHRFSLRGKNKLRNGLFLSGIGMIVSILLCVIHALLVFLSYPEIDQFTEKVLLQSFFYNIDKMIIVYCVLVLLQQAVTYYREVQEKEVKESLLQTQLAQAQMQALKMQLQPHFLFNTLNAIVTLVHKNPDLAEEMIIKLSDFLRLTLEASGKQIVTLKEELSFVNAYIDIERIRFEDKLEYHENIADEILNADVPLLLLQPLVENAIKHGISKYSAANLLEIEAYRNNGNLVINVNDNGIPAALVDEAMQKNGIGLTNTKSRLEALYGAGAALTVTPNGTSGVTVRISLPLTIEGHANEYPDSR